MKKLFFRRGQSLADLALIIGVVGLVFIGMNAYIKRGVQGRVKDLTDYIVSDKQATVENAVASTSWLTADSTMVSKEFKGGARNFTITEDSTSHYEQ